MINQLLSDTHAVRFRIIRGPYTDMLAIDAQKWTMACDNNPWL